MDHTTATQPGTVALEPPSTVLNPETVSGISGGGQPSISEPKGNSIESVLEGELNRIKSEEAKSDEKAGTKAPIDDKAKQDKDTKSEPEKKGDDKPAKARGDDGKFAKGDEPAKVEKSAPEQAATERGAQDDNRQSEGREQSEPPARFLPEARTKWANVPKEVKAEFHRVSQEMETELSQSKEARERYEPIRHFDDLARSNGRNLNESLAKVVQIEQHIARDPIGAIDTILREIGPRRADGSPLSLYEVALAVVERGPQAQHQPQYQDQAPSAPDPQVSALAQEIHSLKTQMATASIQPMIERFVSEHSDYHTLEPQIEAVLKSGVIDTIYGKGLSPDQKLAEAYRMAGGSMSLSRSAPESGLTNFDAKTAPSQDNSPKAAVNAGTKSIKGAPSDGMDTVVEEAETDLREILRKELRKISA